MRTPKQEPVFLHGKQIGVILDDKRGKTFRTWRYSQDYHVQQQGYAIPLLVLQALKAVGIERVEMLFGCPHETVEDSKIEWWIEHGMRVAGTLGEISCVLPSDVRRKLHIKLLNSTLEDWL